MTTLHLLLVFSPFVLFDITATIYKHTTNNRSLGIRAAERAVQPVGARFRSANRAYGQ